MLKTSRTILMAVIALTPLMLGCGLFKTREPLPGGGSGTPCPTPTSPDVTVSNVLERYGDIAGVPCYVSMLDGSFQFHADVSDSNEALPDSVFSNWTRDVEQRVTSNIAANATFRMAVFDSEY